MARLTNDDAADVNGIQPDWAPPADRRRTRGIVLGYTKRRSAKEHLNYFRGSSMGIAQIGSDSNLVGDINDQRGFPAVNTVRNSDYLQAPSDTTTGTSSEMGISELS